MHRLLLALAAAGFLALAGQAAAQPRSAPPYATPSPTPSPPPAPPQSQSSDDQPTEPPQRQLTEADKAFATRAAANGLAEVQLGQLAVQKGTTIRAKQFGTRLATDHDQANQELQQIATEANLDLPSQPDRISSTTFMRLRGTPGPDFDTAFAQAMVQAHQRDIADFRRQAQSGKDPALKDFANRYLPMMQQHLQMARSLLAPTS